MDIIKQILTKIDAIRLRKGLSVFKLTELAGLSENTIYNWYNRNAVPTIVALNAICKVLEVSMAELFADQKEVLTLQEEKLISGFGQLTENQKKIITDLICEFQKG